MAKKRLTQRELSGFSCEKSPLKKMCTGWSNVESGSRLNYEATDGSFISSSFSHLKGKGKKKNCFFPLSISRSEAYFPTLYLNRFSPVADIWEGLEEAESHFIYRPNWGRQGQDLRAWISVLPPPTHKHLLTDLKLRLLSFTPGVSYSKTYVQSNFSICRISIVV